MTGWPASAKAMERVCGPKCSDDANYRATLIEVAVFLNAALTAFDVRHNLALDPSRGIGVVHGVLDIAAQRVRSSIDAGPDAPLFAPAPTRAAYLDEIATRLCKYMVDRGAIDPAFCTPH